MENNKDSYKVLLSLAAKMGKMMFWRYFPEEDKLEISSRSFLKSEGFSEVDKVNKQNSFFRYVETIFPNDKKRFLKCVYGLSEDREGAFCYDCNIAGEVRHQYCEYTRIYEKGKEIILGVIQDITKVKKEEERNAKIIEAIPDFIFIFNEYFFITDVLKAPEIELLHPVDYLIGVDGREIYSPEVSQLFVESIHKCLQNKKMQNIEYSLHAQGKTHYFQARMVPFDNHLVMALIHDIGERVRYTQELIAARRKAEEADKMKSTFLANMSHEIRTPLNAIIGFSELLTNCEDENEKKDYIAIIRENNDLLIQLVNDILDLSRLESGKTEMHLQEVNLNQVLENVYRIYQVKMKPGIQLEKDLPQEKILLLTDQNRITQILFNLMTNAIKNTQKGKITLRVKLEKEKVNISVKDTGCGISKDKIPYIFERFNKINDFVQGTGLGLAICKNIIEKLGGEISVSSLLGKGSTFTFSLPRHFGRDKEKNDITVPIYEENTRKNKLTILVAEDVEANFLLLNALLKHDYIILWARNGEEAVETCRKEIPDLILMDIKMPVKNGIQATREIREFLQDIPILAVTAHAFSSEKQEALEAGCNEIILKPYSSGTLKNAIRKYLP